MDGAAARLGELFGVHGFDRSLAGMKLLEAKDGKALVRLEVTDAVQNMGGTLHGGAIATLVDDAGTVAIISKDRDHRPGVTTDLNVSYFNPGPGGTFVLAEATVLKIGRTLAYVSVDIKRETDGVLVAQGRMTKFMG
jgi:acyl-coenzyme A thioesterase 13